MSLSPRYLRRLIAVQESRIRAAGSSGLAYFADLADLKRRVRRPRRDLARILRRIRILSGATFITPPTVGAIGTGFGTSTTSSTVSQTVTTENLIVLFIAYRGGAANTAFTITRDGQTFTKAIDSTGFSLTGLNCQLFYLVSPNAGTANITIDSGATSMLQIEGIGVGINGGNIASPIGTPEIAGASGNGPLSVTPTTSVGQLVLGFSGRFTAGGLTTISALAAGETEIATVSQPAHQAWASSKAASSPDTLISRTYVPNGSATTNVLGVGVHPA